MSIVFALASVVQLVATAFLLWVAVENSRAFTLSKNSEWLQGNPEFKEKFKKCSPAFILIAFGTVLLATLLNLLNNSVETAWTLKNSGIIAVLFVGLAIYYFKEKSIEKSIPEKTVRSATLQRRTIEQYVSKSAKNFSFVIAGIVITFNAVSYLLGRISIAELTFDMIFALFVYGVCFGTIFHLIRKKEPHTKELEPFTRENISENYRAFSIRLMLGAVFFFSILLLTFTAVQWGNNSLIITPAVSKVYGWFGETLPNALLSKYLWDSILSLLSAVLFVYMGTHKSLQNYRSSKLFS